MLCDVTKALGRRAAQGVEDVPQVLSLCGALCGQPRVQLAGIVVQALQMGAQRSAVTVGRVQFERDLGKLRQAFAEF